MNELLPFLTKQQGMSKKVAIRTIRKVDVNGDGVVDRFEFRALLVSFVLVRPCHVTQRTYCSVSLSVHPFNTRMACAGELGCAAKVSENAGGRFYPT